MTVPTDTSTILVVDDEANIRFFLEQFLTREGYQVVTVTSGEAALTKLATTEFDLVMLDLKMKGVSGLEVLADLRRRWPDTSVIILTAHASLESAVEAVRYGAQDYLFKPCKTLDLRKSVRAALLKRQEVLYRRQLLGYSILPAPVSSFAEPSPTDRFTQHNGIIVDSVRHLATLDGVLLELSPTEFDLLAYLVNEAPRIISAQELIREVRGYETDTSEAAKIVRTHVYHIRQKMQAAAGRSAIVTVRGVGFGLRS